MNNGDYVWHNDHIGILGLLTNPGAEDSFWFIWESNAVECELSACESLATRLGRQSEWVFKHLGETDSDGVQRYEDNTVRLELDPLDNRLYVHDSTNGREIMVCEAGHLYVPVRLAVYEPNEGFRHLYHIHQLYKDYAPQT